MTEETKHSLAAKELDNKSKQQEKTSVEPKSFKKPHEHFQNVTLEPQAVNGPAKFAEKQRDNTQQREAIIRPQKAGKIDFKLLQNHPFSRNRTWSAMKDPQSPSGRNRNRDRSRKSGKGERGNPQQLYRLSVTNPRSNPTIGIAYPQQKVSPVKQLESGRGPVSGSYRFQVPHISEREAQQEELHFRCFQEDSQNLSSQSYTSKAVDLTSGEAAHHHPPAAPQQHKLSCLENNSPPPAEENAFADFQLRETESWQSPKRTSQKPLNKANSCMPLSFQYTYPLIDESASDSVPCKQNIQSQRYTDISFNTNQVSHNSFSFQSPLEGHVVRQTSTQYVSDQIQERQLYPKPPQYMPTAHSLSPAPTNAESLVPSTGQSEQSKNVFIQGSAHHIRNSSSHVISPPHKGRASHPWEGPNKAFPAPLMEKTSTPYPYQYQPSAKQRLNTGVNGRVPWQQTCFTTAPPHQNRIDISRQLTNQHHFLISPSDLQDNSEPHINNVPNKTTTEAFTSVPVTSSRKSIYPVLCGAQVGLRISSPFDSPSHSPTQNNSTCSSLSPASTSSLSSNPDDSQTSKVLPPQFYQQQQDKASISSNNLSNSQNNVEASRGLHSKAERAKENLNFIPNNRDPKLNMESGKNCLDTYRTERTPPPPYSTHQLLTTSLAAANLDQLDVLLTCKQCDQNFNNLASFLDHKLYCGQHTFAQNDLKDLPKMEDGRKFQAGHTKAMSSESSYEILRSSSDMHLSLLGLNKNGEIVSDNETKGDIKNDPIKLMLPSAPLPDLEMEDPKLDSLITEALNGLGYHDNAEIDSSFIDAFVDDDLSTSKSTSTKQALTTKDPTAFEGKTNNELTSKVTDKYAFDSASGSPNSDSKHTDSPSEEHQLEEGLQTVASPKEPTSKNCSKQIEWTNNEQENDSASKFLLSSTFSARCGLKSLQSSTALVKSMCPRSTRVTMSPTAHKPTATEGKRKKKNAGESWSKELIHKIVQQKNKLQVKGTKNMQFSLVMERVTPAVQTSRLQEYDYVSDSDEDGEPVKRASQGRLSQSIRCRYTYTKECRGRIREARKALNVSPSIIKESPSHQRLCRQSSRSSTSSELSTSISISTDNSSPKSVDRTDSDSEKRMEVQNNQENLQQDGYEDSSPSRGESSTSLALTFMKNTKRFSTDKILLTEHKDRFTTSECSSMICKTEESASEATITKSTISLARFKTTRVKIEENLDHCGFETGILGTSEEPFNKDHSKNITSPRGTATTFHPIETTNNRESSHVFKLKKKDVVTSKGKSHKSRTNCSESSGAIFEKSNCEASSSEETKRSSNDPFSNEALTPCSSLMNNVCLSPSKIHDSSPQEDEQCPMPYTSDHDQSPIKSPLSFDTTSMFGDLTVAGFENNLYPDIQLTKESFSPSETTAEKKELFESSFSPFLEHRDWNLMVDVTAELPDEISQYKDDSDSDESKDNFNHVSFSLPEKIMDYNSNLNSSVSADDLEIKRIVTELENQLQMAKLSCPPPLDNELQKQLTVSKCSPLRLNPESEDEDNSLEMNCTSEILPTATPADSQSALFSAPDLPWTSPLQFGLMCRQQSLHIPAHSSAINTSADSGHKHMDLKDSTENHSSLHREDKTEKNKFLDHSTSKSEEMLEHEMYTENLMKSLEVISDSLSSGFTSPHSSPSQECEVLEDHDKPESERSESRTLETELHNNKFVGNEHSDCETFINQTEKAEDDMKTDVTDSMTVTQILHFNKTSTAENIMCAEEEHNCDGKESVILLEPDKKNEHLSNITGGTSDNPCKTDVQPSNIKSTFSKDFLSTHSQHGEICEINSQQVSSPKDLSVVKDDHGCSDSVQKAMSDLTPFPAQSESEDNQQKSFEESPGPVTVIHSPQSPSVNDSEKLDNQMIPNEHKVLLRSTVLDEETKTKSSDLTSPGFQNKGPCLKPSETKTLPKKVGMQNAVQGKIQCEICAMFFRTLPGLKRHTAMKHVVKTEGISPIEAVNMNNQESNPMEKELKDCMDAIGPATLLETDRKLLAGQATQAAVMFEGITDDATSNISGNHDLHQTSPKNEKAHNNTSKNNISSEMFSPKLETQDNFSDEILGVLKTDILQVISPNSPSMEVRVSEEQKHKETVFTKHPVWFKTGAECDINVKHESFCPPEDDSHTLTDLKDVSDDEGSFSQLFPRNNDRKRKKCARVYGKSNKKQKQLSCLDLNSSPADVITDTCEESEENQILHNDTKDLCEYKTTSVNEANMPEMCHNSSVQSSTENTCHSNDDLTGVCVENVETGITGSLCETEDTSRQPTMHQEDTKSSVSQADVKPDVSTTVCCPNPKTTAEVPVSLSEPEPDKTSVQPITSTELIDPVVPGKTSIEQKCRKRIEPGLKTKDKQYKCKVCFTWFFTLGELNFHKLSHNPSPPPTCYMCVQRKFSSREQLRDHLREKHAKNKAGVWTCGMCLKEISDVWMYNEHLREHATQFARRGQSQSSLLDVPGGFMQENAVRNFISSIMQHRPSRPAKGDVKPPPKEEKNASLGVNGQEKKIKDEFDSTAPQGGGKHSTLTTPELLPEAETSSKNVEMHPNCKDPSRDCHHCGKQFPKPFKLQRHLVVHSLQKIFLCHKCPVSYQEAKELKDHMKNEHEDKDEPDTKHTTLYNCELCANVMHVIKKSFICSTCNYTFSKKEQFDRHMEKHLAGGNKIFKFRGVVRPGKHFNFKDGKSVMPPSKKRKAAQSSSNNSLDNLNINKSTNKQGMKSVLPIINDTLQKSTNECSAETNTSVKTEHVAEDILKVAQCLVQKDSTEPTTELKEEDANCSLSQECESTELNAVDEEALTEICDVKVEGDCAAVLLENHTSKDSAEQNPPVNPKTAAEQTETMDSDACTTPACSQSDISLPKHPSCKTAQLKKDQTIKESFSINEIKKKQVHTPSPNEQPAAGLDKHITAVSAEDSLRPSDPGCVNTTDAAVSQSPHASITHNSSRPQKVSTRQQKKRKDLKPLSTTARENLGIDLRVKKFRTGRCENIDGPVLASVKEDTASNKNIYRNKTGSSDLGFQLKKGSVGSLLPKKMEVVHHFSRDCKGKTNIPGRPPQSSFRMSTHKSQLKPGVQTKETFSYRTAESQNNLLSQLFGQRLTSFKIPLRKEASEVVS